MWDYYHRRFRPVKAKLAAHGWDEGPEWDRLLARKMMRML